MTDSLEGNGVAGTPHFFDLRFASSHDETLSCGFMHQNASAPHLVVGAGRGVPHGPPPGRLAPHLEMAEVSSKAEWVAVSTSASSSGKRMLLQSACQLFSMGAAPTGVCGTTCICRAHERHSVCRYILGYLRQPRIAATAATTTASHRRSARLPAPASSHMDPSPQPSPSHASRSSEPRSSWGHARGS